MKQDDTHQLWRKRLASAPKGAYLAVDFIKVKHEGEHIEGVDQQFSHEGIIWGQRFTTSALVFADGQDPYLLRADAALSERMATADYPYLTASEAMMNVVGDVLLSGYELKGVLVDAEFSSKLTLRSRPHFPVGIIGRFRSSTSVDYQGKRLQAKVLAEQFRPGKARFYKKLGLYAKRLTVVLPEVGKLDLILIWVPQSSGFALTILVSTIKAGLQELLKAFRARWGLEVMHRVLRQNLALARCQCLAFIAQLRHLDFCIEALHHLRFLRQHAPALSWKQAQKLAAEQARIALLTETKQLAA